MKKQEVLIMQENTVNQYGKQTYFTVFLDGQAIFSGTQEEFCEKLTGFNLAKQIKSLEELNLAPKDHEACLERLKKGAETYGETNFLKADLIEEIQQEIWDIHNYNALAKLKGEIGFVDSEELRKATLHLQSVLDKIKKGDDYDRTDNYEFE